MKPPNSLFIRTFTMLVVTCNLTTWAEIQPVQAPTHVELHDQHDAPQSLSFPATNVVLLTIADREGSAQVDGWITALKSRYAGRVDIRGLADCGGAPAFLRGRIRKKFQETRSHPVMMDWSGKVCAQFGYERGAANLLVIARNGRITARFSGAANEAQLRSLSEALEQAMADAGTSPRTTE